MKYSFYIFFLFISQLAFSQESDCNALDGHFEIGDTWTYEKVEYLGSPIEKTFAFTQTITDTTSYEGNTVFIVNSGRFYIDDGKMYYYDDILERYIMYYDFASTDDYYIKIACDFNEPDDGIDSMLVTVDSVYFTAIENISIRTRDLSIHFDDMLFNKLVVYDYLGAVEIPNGDWSNLDIHACALWSHSYTISELRCFTSSNCDLKFVDYSCDTTFFATSTEDIMLSGMDIYPNPTSGLLHIDFEQSLSGQLSIFSLDGRVVYREVLDHSTHTSMDLSEFNKGLYLIKIRSDEGVLTRKVVVR